MIKACIFDFDGVIIDNERFWERHKKQMYVEVYGPKVAEKLNKTLGLNMDAIHAAAISFGSTVPVQLLYDACNRHAEHVYRDAPVTEGVDTLLERLASLQLKFAIVSASPKSWINIALSRIQQRDAFAFIISLQDRLDLAHKPSPDGYIEAMKMLNVTPKETIIIEDSNTGIVSAKASGAYTVGLRQNLVKDYSIGGADMYVDKIIKIADIVEKL